MGRVPSVSHMVSQALCCFSATKVGKIMVLWLPLQQRRDIKSVSVKKKVNAYYYFLNISSISNCLLYFLM
jgi:hypothetical protein